MEMESEQKSKKGILHLEKWGVRFTSLLTLAMGAINLLSAVQPALVNRLNLINSVFPLEVRHGSRITSALAGFGLIVLATNLFRRKRTAYIFSLALLVVTIISHMVKGLDFEESSLALFLIVLLALLRNSFHAESDRPSVRRGLFILVIAFIFTLAYGSVGFFLLDKHFSTQFNLPDAIRQTIIMFSSYYNPGLQPLTGFGKFFADSIYIIGFATVGFAILSLISPVLVRQPASASERARAKEIVEKYGCSSLSRAKLFNDKSYFFASEESMIAYAAHRRGVMVLGDPVCPPGQVAESIRKFREFCTLKDWTPAFISVLPDYIEHYRAAGFDIACIGYEGIVSLQNFGLEGSRNKDLRNVVSRLERHQFRVEIPQPPLQNQLMANLEEINDAWLTMRKGGEMHFSDGWFNDEYIRNGPVAILRNPEDLVVAFANLVPEYQKNEMTIDLMRHFPHLENGGMEYLFIRILQWVKEQGYETFSLGLSAVEGVGEKPEDPFVERALHTIVENFSNLVNFKGLRKFKEKFNPSWEPRYLAYPGAASLPLVINTLLRVHQHKQ